MPTLPPPPSGENLSHQAQHVWAMLDEMSERDPAAYKAFIDRQIADGRKAMSPPQIHMCVQTSISGPSSPRLYINVCEWTRIPGPKDDQAPIPVIGGVMYTGADQTGKYKCVAAALNPEVLKEFGRESKFAEGRKMLINLIIDFLQDQHKFTISRSYTVLPEDSLCKGPPEAALSSLTKRTQTQDSEFKQTLGDLEKSFGPLAEGCSDSLLGQLSNITIEDTPSDQPSKQSFAQELKMPGQAAATKPGLVQELGGSVQPEYDPEPEGSRLPEPQYDVTVENQSLVVRIQLPGVHSVGECELDISQDDLTLLVTDQYQLSVSLPHTVDETAATAKYSKKSAVLTLRLPQCAGR